jgi:hypothetical protein
MTNQLTNTSMSKTDATLDVSQQTKDSVRQTMTDSNTAPSATPVAHEIEILPPDTLPTEITAASIRPDVVSDNKLIGICKVQAKMTFSSFGILYRDSSNLAVIYDEMVERFRDQHKAKKKRDGKPTLKDAFKQAGWNYNAARQFRSRWKAFQKKRLLTNDDSPEKLPALTAGDKVRDLEDDVVYTVAEAVASGDMKANLVYEDDDESIEKPATRLYDGDGIPKFKKETPPIRKIAVGDLLQFNGTEYAVKQDGNVPILQRTKTPTIVDQKKTAEAKKTKKKNPPDLATQPPSIPSTEKAAVKKPSTKKKETVAPGTFVAAQIGFETGEFAVFGETDNTKTTNSAVSSIYKTMKEAEDHRDRLNAKYGKADAAAA